MGVFTKSDLKRLQSMPLEEKYYTSLAKVGEWYSYWNNEVYVAFSGGKDSTVLADIVAHWCSCIGSILYLVFVNTGLEYPEIQKFVKEYAEYLSEKYQIEVVLDILRPKMRFDEVIKKYGYPMISKEVSKCVSSGKRLDSKFGQVCRDRLSGTHKQKSGKISLFNCEKYAPLLDVDFDISHRCCDIMKKQPSHDYAKTTGRHPIVATLAEESRLREQQWIQHGCNGFDMSSPVSNPLSFWTEQDILNYIKIYNIPIATVYGEIEYVSDPLQVRFEGEGLTYELRTSGCSRTGCIFCGFGCHKEKSPSRFERLKGTHPRQYEYCIGGGEYDENGIWKPNKQGLGMGHVFDELNKIYGEGFIKY